jgi:hypothetical protein
MDDSLAAAAASSEPPTDTGSPVSRKSWSTRFKTFLSFSHVAECWTLVALSLYTYFAYKQSIIMQSQLDVLDKQAAIAQSQLYAQTGALAVTGFQADILEDGRMSMFSIQIENPRPTPAQIVVFKCKMSLVPASARFPDVNTLTDLADIGGGTVVHTLFLSVAPPRTLTAEEIQLIRSGTMRLCFLGQIQYEDGLEPLARRHSLPFCKVYTELKWQDCSLSPPNR